MRRYIPYAAGLTVAWVMLWDRIAVANVLGGLCVAAVLLALFPLQPVDPAERRIVRPVALVRLAAAVLRELAVSNLLVTREIVSPRRSLRTGVVACQMRSDSPKLLSTVANIIALSPGTMAVDATDDSAPTLYVHVLTLDNLLDVRRKVSRLERLVIEALGSTGDRAALSADTRHTSPEDTERTR